MIFKKRRNVIILLIALAVAIYSSTFVTIIITSRIRDGHTGSLERSMSHPVVPLDLPSPNHVIHKKQAWNSTIINLCFATSEFSDTVQEADRLPVLDPSMIRNPPRHFIFTNLPSLAVGDGWKTILLENLTYRRMITQSRWPKFLGWQHPELQECQVIFYLDAYLCNPINETAWNHMAKLILQSPVGLMQGKQIGSNNKPVKGPVIELRKNARMGKVSWEAANATIEWLRKQSNYERMGHVPVFKNAMFGYDPLNSKFRRMLQDFWQEYSKETASWRDQSYWAYFLYKHSMKPLGFPFPPPLGPEGERGHNGHIYVEPSDPKT
jgi:hypothetical protein